MTVNEKLDKIISRTVNDFDVTMPRYHSFILSCTGLEYINYSLPAGGDTATSLRVTRSYNREPIVTTGSGASISTTSEKAVIIFSGKSSTDRVGIIETLGCDVLIIHGENALNLRYWIG